MDRVLLVTRYSTDPEALQLAKKLTEKGIPLLPFLLIWKKP